MPNGTLYDQLHHVKPEVVVMGWDKILRIATQLARGTLPPSNGWGSCLELTKAILIEVTLAHTATE